MPLHCFASAVQGGGGVRVCRMRHHLITCAAPLSPPPPSTGGPQVWRPQGRGRTLRAQRGAAGTTAARRRAGERAARGHGCGLRRGVVGGAACWGVMQGSAHPASWQGRLERRTVACWMRCTLPLCRPRPARVRAAGGGSGQGSRAGDARAGGHGATHGRHARPPTAPAPQRLGAAAAGGARERVVRPRAQATQHAVHQHTWRAGRAGGSCCRRCFWLHLARSPACTHTLPSPCPPACAARSCSQSWASSWRRLRVRPATAARRAPASPPCCRPCTCQQSLRWGRCGSAPGATRRTRTWRLQRGSCWSGCASTARRRSAPARAEPGWGTSDRSGGGRNITEARPNA